MPQPQGARRLFQIRQRQMGRAVKPARTEDERVRMRLGSGDELAQRLVGLLVVDEKQDRLRNQACERNEVGAGDLGRTAKQLVDLGVTGDPGVVRQQRIAVGLGGGDELGADLPRGAGLGLDHDRLLEDRLHGRGQRPRHDIVGAAGRKRVDDGDRMRGKSLLRECRSGRERARGGSDEETTAVHGLSSRIGILRRLPRSTRVFAHYGCPARQAQTAVQGQTDTGSPRSSRRHPKADTTRGRGSTSDAACWPKSAAIRSAAIRRWAATRVMQRADMRSKRSGAVSIARNVGIGLLALTLTCLHSSAHAQSADLVLCDRLAADPADPDKPKDVKGVLEIEASDVATAIKFCKVASAASRRAFYQLGRAYAANRQLPEAVGAYRKAADKGSTSAMVELGVLLATGTGVAKDEAQARKLVRARRRGRQSARRQQSRGPQRERRRSARSGQGQSLAGESSGNEFSGSAVSTRLDDCGGRRRTEGRRCRAGGVRKGGGARSSRRIGAHGRVCTKRARRSAGCKRRQSLLRESRDAWQRRRQGGAQARAMSLRDQRQTPKRRNDALLLARISIRRRWAKALNTARSRAFAGTGSRRARWQAR